VTNETADERGRESLVDRLENYLLEGIGDLSNLKEELAIQLADARFIGDDQGTEALEELLTLLEAESAPDPAEVLSRIFAFRETELSGEKESDPRENFVSFDIPSGEMSGKVVSDEGRFLLRQAENQGKKLYLLEVTVPSQCRDQVLDIIESEFAVIRTERSGDGEGLSAVVVTDSTPMVSHLLRNRLSEECNRVESHIRELNYRDLLPPRSVARRWYERVPPVAVTPSFETIDRTLVLLREAGRGNTERTEPIWRELAETIVQAFSINLRTVLEQMRPALVELGEELQKNVMIQVVGDTPGVSAAYAASLREHIFELLENAIRHGIETPEERRNKGKPETGMIRVMVYPKPQHLSIRVRDDGRGVNEEEIRAAFSHSHERGLSRLRHILQEQFGGTLSLRTGERGTTVEIDIPYGMNIYRALVYRRRRETFAVPAALVTDVREVTGGTQLVHDAAQGSYIRLDGRAIPYRDVASTGDISGPVGSSGAGKYALVVTAGGYEVALAADEIIRETQVIPDEQNPAVLHVEGVDPPPVAVRISSGMTGQGDG
jgi:two-component sensor histidine kinase